MELIGCRVLFIRGIDKQINEIMYERVYGYGRIRRDDLFVRTLKTGKLRIVDFRLVLIWNNECESDLRVDDANNSIKKLNDLI